MIAQLRTYVALESGSACANLYLAALCLRGSELIMCGVYVALAGAMASMAIKDWKEIRNAVR